MLYNALIGGFQLVLFLVRQFHFFPKTQLLHVNSLHLCPSRFLVVVKEFLDLVAQCPRGAFLVLQLVQVQRIVAVSECQTAGLVVRGHDNQRLFRVLFVESIGLLHCFVHIPHLADRSSGIVSVAGIVDHTALYHHKPPLIALLQERDSGAHDLRQSQIALLAVNGIRQVVAVFGALVIGGLHKDHLLVLRCRVTHQRLCLVIAVRNDVACLLGFAVQVLRLVIVLAFRVMETGAAEEIEMAVTELFADLVVLAAFLYMRVESRRSCMVNSYRRHDTHTPAVCL